MMRRFNFLALPLLAIALISGCVVDTSLFGGTVTVEGSWTVNGAAPTAASCAAAGITSVELVLYDSTETQLDSFQLWNCEKGSFDGRSETFLPRLFHDAYRSQWVAWNGNIEVARTATDVFDVTGAAHGILAPVDFVSAAPPPPPPGFDPTVGGSVTLHGAWLINSAAADPTSCAAAGIDTLELHILEDGGTGDYLYNTWSCGDGSFDGRTDTTLPLIAQGRYNTQWYAVNASGTEVGRSDPLLLDVSTVTDAGLASPDFTYTPPAPGLDATIGWAIDATATPTYGTCTEAAVDDFFFELDDSTGAFVTDSNAVAGADTAGRIPCTESLSFSDLTAGTYSLYFDGAAADGTKWMATCDMLIVDTGIASYDCFIDQA